MWDEGCKKTRSAQLAGLFSSQSRTAVQSVFCLRRPHGRSLPRRAEPAASSRGKRALAGDVPGRRDACLGGVRRNPPFVPLYTGGKYLESQGKAELLLVRCNVWCKFKLLGSVSFLVGNKIQENPCRQETAAHQKLSLGMRCVPVSDFSGLFTRGAGRVFVCRFLAFLCFAVPRESAHNGTRARRHERKTYCAVPNRVPSPFVGGLGHCLCAGQRVHWFRNICKHRSCADR